MTGPRCSYQFDGIVVDGANFRAFRDGQPVTLEPKAFQVLHYLAEHPGRVVTKDELIRAVWAGAFVSDNALTRVIAQLRRGLGDDARQARYIETVPTQGYRFLARVQPASGGPVAVARSAGRPWVRRWQPWAAVAVLALAGAMWRFSRGGAAKVLQPGGLPVQYTSTAGLNVGASFSPDGSMLAYASDKSGAFEIYVRPVAPGGREVQVTRDGGQNVEPAWSPDGTTIAYHSMANRGVHVIPALGGASRRLTASGAEPAWSADGKWIVYRSGNVISMAISDLIPGRRTQILAIPAGGGAPREVTRMNEPACSHGAPSWSPDGKRVLFACYGKETGSLWTASAEGGELSEIPVGGNYLDPVFAPDGESVLALGRRPGGDFGVWRIPAAGGRADEVARLGMTVPRKLAISRDGRRVAYAATQMTSNLFVLRLNPQGKPAGVPRELTRESTFRVTMPRFSPDGSRIAYWVRRYGAESDIYVAPVEGGEPAQVTTAPAADLMPNWTPGGDALLYSSLRSGRFELWRTNLKDGSEVRIGPLREAKALAQLAPDGKSYVYQKLENGRMSLWRVNLSGGGQRRLTPEDVSVGYGCWSRDGIWLAAEMWEGDNTQIVMLPSEGGTPRKVTTRDGIHWSSSFSPDGSYILTAILREGVWKVAAISRETGAERMLEDAKLARRFLRFPDWSPRGNHIAYEQAETRGNIFLAELR